MVTGKPVDRSENRPAAAGTARGRSDLCERLLRPAAADYNIIMYYAY